MKAKIIVILTLFISVLMTSCDEDVLVFDDVNGQTLAKFTATCGLALA